MGNIGGGIIGGRGGRGGSGTAAGGTAVLGSGQQQQSVAGVHCGVQGAVHIPSHGLNGPDGPDGAVLTGAIVAAWVAPEV